MQRFFRNAGVLLKWLLLAPFLLIKGYLWILFVAPRVVARINDDFPKSIEEFDQAMRTDPFEMCCSLCPAVAVTILSWMLLVVLPFLAVVLSHS